MSVAACALSPRHGAPLRRITDLADIAAPAPAWGAPAVVWRPIFPACRTPAPAPAFLFGGQGAAMARACAGQIDQPACGCFALEDAAAGPSAVVIKDGTAFYGDAIGTPERVAAALAHRLNARAITTGQAAGPLVALFGALPGDPADMLCEVLPRLGLLAAAGFDADRAAFLIPADLADAPLALLLAAGVRKAQLMPARLTDDIVRAPRLLVPSALRQGGRFPPCMPALTGYWTERIRRHLDLPPPCPASGLFLSPRDAAEPSGIADWQAIEAAAEAAGLTIVHPASLGLRERLALFSQAACVMGFQGAAMMEACAWAQAGIPLCIVRSSLDRDLRLVAFAGSLRHRLGLLFGQGDPEDLAAPAVVDGGDVQRALTHLQLMRA